MSKFRKHLWPVLVSSLPAALILSGMAHAVPRDVHMGSAPLISPSSAWTYYLSEETAISETCLANNTNCPAALTRGDRVQSLALALGNDPERLAAYVRENIEFAPMFGVQKGSEGALLDGAGTAFDQAILLTDLLREAGFTASVVVGDASYDMTIIEDWLGTTNVTAVERMLADGGIPAIVTGSSVTMLHAWVEATVSGQTVYYDPSVKAYDERTAENIKSLMGFTSGASLLSGAGASGTATYKKNINQSSLKTSLVGFATTLADNLDSPSHRAKSVDELLGVAREKGNHVSGTELTSSPGTARRSFSGDVSPVFKSSFQFQIGSAFDETFYPEDLAGARIAITFESALSSGAVAYDSNSSWKRQVPDELQLRVNEEILATYTVPINHISMWTLDLTINHPYAADSGAYMDEAVEHKMLMDNWPAIVASFGPVSERSVTEIERLNLSEGILTRAYEQNTVSVDGQDYGLFGEAQGQNWWQQATNNSVMNGTFSTYIPPSGGEQGYYAVDPIIDIYNYFDNLSTSFPLNMQTLELPDFESQISWPSTARYKTKQVIGRKLLAQISQAGRLHAAIQGGEFQHHHSVGIIDSDLSIHPENNQITEDMLRASIETTYSYNTHTSDADKRRTFTRAFTTTASALEGTTFQQFLDSPHPLSTISMLSWLNENTQSGGDYTGSQDGFYLIDPTDGGASASVAAGAIRNSSDYFDNSVSDDFVARVMGYKEYLDAGYKVLVGSRRFLGPVERSRQVIFAGTGDNSGKYFGNGFIAFKPGDTGGMAHIVRGEAPPDVSLYFSRSSKGGGAPSISAPDASLEVSGDFLEAQFSGIDAGFSVVTSDGSLTVGPVTDLKTGQGEFPYSLSYERTYNSTAPGTIDHEFAQGWRDNWDISAEISTSSSALFGEDGPAASASATIAAFVAMQEIAEQGDTLGAILAINEVAAWWQDYAIENMVYINTSSGPIAFYKVPDDSASLGFRFVPSTGTAKLTQTGEKAPQTTSNIAIENDYLVGPNTGYDTLYVRSAYDYDPISFTYEGESGDVISFASGETLYPPCDILGPGSEPRYGRGSTRWQPTSWVFPFGVTLSFAYSGGETKTITNNLGRSLTVSPSQVQDGNGQSVTYSYEEDKTCTFGSTMSIKLLTEVTRTVDGTDRTWKYDYDLDPVFGTLQSSDLIVGGLAINYSLRDLQPVLKSAFLPSDQTTPHMTFDWDDRKRVSSVTDKEGHQWTYDIAERAGRMTGPTGASMVEVYNSDDQPVLSIDPVGRVATQFYDDRGRVREIRSYGAGELVTPTGGAAYAYDHLDNRLVTVALPNETLAVATAAFCQRMTYETTFNYMATESDAYEGNISSAAVGEANATALCGAVPADKAVTHYTYNETGNGISMASQMHLEDGSGPLGPETSWLYDAFGRVTRASVKTDGSTTEHTDYAYDASGFMASVTLAPGLPEESKSEFLSYTTHGDPQQMKDPRGNITDVIYDGLRRIKTITAPAPTSGAFRPLTEADYDLDGRISFVRNATGEAAPEDWATTTYTYRANGRLEKITDPESFETKTVYDDAGRAILSVDAEGRMVRTVYDAAGRVTKLIKAWQGNDDGTGGTEACTVPGTLQQCYQQYTYTPNGQIETVTDANGNITTYYYDGHDRLAATHFPSKDTPGQSAIDVDYELYTYDANGNMLTKRTRSGDIITYQYDALNRPISRLVPGAPTHTVAGATISHSYTYDLAGRQLTALHDGVTLGWSYDAAGRMVSATRNGTDPVSYGYDAAGNVTSLTWPDGYEMAFEYDALNRVDRALEVMAVGPDRELASLAYDPLSRRTSVSYANGTGATYAYTKRGDLTDHTITLPSLPANPADIDYDFTYNGVGQLTSETVSEAAMMWLPEWSSTKTYGSNGLNQLVSLKEGAAPALPVVYDGRGNLTDDGRGKTFSYDAENVLRQVDEGGSLLASYKYGADNTRLEKSVSGQPVAEYWYTGDQEIMETDSAGATVRRYIRLPGSVDETFLMIDYSMGGTPVETWAHTNRLGSTVATSDAVGMVSDTYTYDDYGTAGTEGTSGFPFRFTGQKLDPETGLMYYKARYYSTDFGRFLQVDSIGYKDQMNFYAYVHNDPHNFRDSNGKEATPCNGPCNFSYSATGVPDQINGGVKGCGGRPCRPDEIAMAFAVVGIFVLAVTPIPGDEAAAVSVLAGRTAYASSSSRTALATGAVGGTRVRPGYGPGGRTSTGARGKPISGVELGTLLGVTAYVGLQLLPTTLYKLVDRNDQTQVLKYGISVIPSLRYTRKYLDKENADMVIIRTYRTRPPARNEERRLCKRYLARNGKRPPLSKRC